MKEKGLLDPDIALGIILESVPVTDTERISLGAALDRVLAEDVQASEDLPPFDNSAMDGYAVLAADTAGACRDNPVKLAVLATEPAGTVVSQRVTTGTAVRIMTGAAIPSGANAVVIVEHTESQDDVVYIYQEVRPGTNIRPTGEDIRQGARVLNRGRRIDPAAMGILAALGHSEVSVSGRPRVAVITTGSEIVDVSQRPGPGQIRDSNSYSIIGQVIDAGGEISMSRRVKDERSELEQALSEAAKVSDVVVTSGGVSVGEYDFVKDTLAKLGDIRFWKVAIKPGKPFVYGLIQGKPLFGLPGNPVSSMVTFDLFVRPALLRMAGIESVFRPTVPGTASQAIKHRAGRRAFIRAVSVFSDGAYVATPTGDQGSGRLSSMLDANSYIVISEEKGDIDAGDPVEIMLLD